MREALRLECVERIDKASDAPADAATQPCPVRTAVAEFSQQRCIDVSLSKMREVIERNLIRHAIRHAGSCCSIDAILPLRSDDRAGSGLLVGIARAVPLLSRQWCCRYDVTVAVGTDEEQGVALLAETVSLQIPLAGSLRHASSQAG